jgi:hypothetical protein
MKLCQANADRWAAVLTKQEGAEDMPGGFNIEVTILMDGQRRTSYCFATVKDKESGCTRYVTRDPVSSYADLLACGLSMQEAELVRLFVLAVEDLCHQLLDGGSVKEWFGKARLHEGKRKAPRSWREQRPLLFTAEKEQFILPW